MTTTTGSTMRVPYLQLVLLFLGALVLNTLFLMKTGADRPMEADAVYYQAIAKSLASGRGYVDPGTYWPTEPTMGRAPGWPFLASIGLWLFPNADANSVMRYSGGLVNAGTAPLIWLLTWFLTRRRSVALMAALAFTINPHGLYLVQLAWSEPAFVFLATLGSIFLVAKSSPRLPYLLLGSFVLGLSVLVRPNFLLFPPMVAGAALLLYVWGEERREVMKNIVTFLICSAVFFMPAGWWMVRNYQISGKFPVVSTIRGETFYGGNNFFVADNLSHWGYWIFPDDIPGETPKGELAQRMNEIELDEYYFNKGKQYLRENWLSSPRLFLGKLVRAYVPVPWKPSMGSYVTNLLRVLLYLAFFATWGIWSRRLPSLWHTVLLGMMLVNLATVLVFYGTARFTYCVEPFMLPAAFLGALVMFERLRKRESYP